MDCRRCPVAELNTCYLGCMQFLSHSGQFYSVVVTMCQEIRQACQYWSISYHIYRLWWWAVETRTRLLCVFSVISARKQDQGTRVEPHDERLLESAKIYSLISFTLSVVGILTGGIALILIILASFGFIWLPFVSLYNTALLSEPLHLLLSGQVF